jgi:photosystem II stability/assembly factor-like uncharacterized protein
VSDTKNGKSEIIVRIEPEIAIEGNEVVLRAENWPPYCPVTIKIDDLVTRPVRVALGTRNYNDILPEVTGSFVCMLPTVDLKQGKHVLELATHHKSADTFKGTFEILEREHASVERDSDIPSDEKEEHEAWYFREIDFYNRRFKKIGFVPENIRQFQIEQILTFRGHVKEKPFELRDYSVFGKCTWNPVGSGPAVVSSTSPTPPVAYAGRTLAIAINNSSPNIMFIGTANGGIWKSTDSGLNWSPKSDYNDSLAIGTIVIDPNDSSRIFAGTGEFHDTGSGGLTYYGSGILKSIDVGETWTNLSTSPSFQGDEISKLLFDPLDATSQHMFLSSATGVYESTDGGLNWTQLRAGSVSDLVVLEVATGPPPKIKIIAAFYGSGLWTSTKTGASWSAWVQITGAGIPPPPLGRIALGQSKNNPQTIYALFTDSGISIAGIAKTIDGGSTWNPVPVSFNIPFALGQLSYNLHISIHPNNANIIYLGEIHLWKNSTGGGTFDALSIQHTDQHCFAFDPVDPDNIVWAGNDGGIYRSGDGGLTWDNRNRNLDTLQYMSISLHPQWETVMIGGTQDNGTHRYSGNPAWKFVDYGDGGFTAIDPNLPTRMYHGYFGNTFYRSDNAGDTWMNKTGSISGIVEFYPPFTLDPSNPDTCYFGNRKLWRSDDNADTWSAITNDLAWTITAIAVHPSDSNTIYVSTSDAHVYKVQRTGSTWALSDITTIDITGMPIPSGLYTSDLAVDTTGNVWLTVSSVTYTEKTGEFTNNHVYRLPAGSTTWETRSTGLAQANPINTIVIDPTKSNILFCGGDLGVFRTEDAGVNWTLWDQGLPNVPIFDLSIHGPRRLLRAATHGRGVWERPIDSLSCPMVDLYIRDNILDSGRVQPSPESSQLPFNPTIQHPFNPTIGVYHWQSVDIKVDAPDPNFQTTLPISDYVSFEGMLIHRNPRPGLTNRFYVQVHNRGIMTATNVRVRAFFGRAAPGLPSLPPDFWSMGKPFIGTPSGTDWLPIGGTIILGDLEPAKPKIVEWDWLVPSGAVIDSCLLAVVTCNEDPLDGSNMFDVDSLVRAKKQVALKNLHVFVPIQLELYHPMIMDLQIKNHMASISDLGINWGGLPSDAVILIAFEKLFDDRTLVLAKPDELKKLGITIVKDQGKYFKEKIDYKCGETKYLDLTHIYQIIQPKDKFSKIPSICIPKEKPIIMAINVILAKDLIVEAQFDVFQMVDRRIIGGNTYLFRPKRKD